MMNRSIEAGTECDFACMRCYFLLQSQLTFQFNCVWGNFNNETTIFIVLTTRQNLYQHGFYFYQTYVVHFAFIIVL